MQNGRREFIKTTGSAIALPALASIGMSAQNA